MFLDIVNTDKYIYELILCRPNVERTEIAYIRCSSLEYSPRFKDITQLNFTVNYFEALPTCSVENQDFSKIIGNYLVKLNIKINNGISDEIIHTQYFIIVNQNLNGIDKDYKELTCFSLEYKLTKRKLRGYKQVAYLYDTNGSNGLLNYLIGQLNNAWTIGTIDSSLLSLQRSFNYASSSYIEVFRDIERLFNAVVEFDTVNMQINIKLLENVGENTGLFISQDNYMSRFSQLEKHDQIITKLYCYGNNNLGIADKNITGQNYLLDLSYYRTSPYMDSDLLTAWNNYDAVLESHKGQFSTYLGQLSTLNSSLLSKQAELAALNVTLLQYQDNENTAIKEELAFGHDYQYWHNMYLAQKIVINNKQAEITSVQNSINTVNANIVTLNNQVSLSNNFTSEQLKLMDTYFISEEDMTISEIADSQTLYDENVYQLNKRKIPVVDITVDSVDLLSVTVARKDWKKINIGDYLNIDYKRYSIDCLPIRLVAYTHDPLNNKLTLTFNNQDEFNDDFYYNSRIYRKSSQTSNTVEVERPNYNLFVDEQGNILYNGQIISSVNNPINLPDGSTIGDNGLVMSDNPSANLQMRILGSRILFTDDAWQTVTVGIDGSGIHAINIDGVNITGSVFTGGTINVTTDANVGNNIYIGNQSDTDSKGIFFNSGSSRYTSIEGTGGALQISADNYLTLVGDGIEIVGDTIALTGNSNIDIDGSSFNVGSETHFTNWVYFEGVSQVFGLYTDSAGLHNHGIPDGTEILTTDGSVVWVESGYHNHTVTT